jgi:hypothetical protein
MSKLWKKIRGNIEQKAFSASNFLAEIRTTRALIKFCEDHDYDLVHIAQIKKCLANLEKGRISEATENYLAVPHCKDGFWDWWPQKKFPHETDDYVWAVFEGLAERWARLMECRIDK